MLCSIFSPLVATAGTKSLLTFTTRVFTYSMSRSDPNCSKSLSISEPESDMGLYGALVWDIPEVPGFGSSVACGLFTVWFNATCFKLFSIDNLNSSRIALSSSCDTTCLLLLFLNNSGIKVETTYEIIC